jgi:gliding motility-associated-like protein
LGNVGFKTDYTFYNNGTVPAIGFQGGYGVATNPKNYYNPFSTCADHTTSSGNMLVADGSTSGTARVWYSQMPITVLPGKNYTFSYFLTSVVNGGPAKIEVLINNSAVGALATAPSSSCLWEEHSYVWNSGTNTTAVITLIDRETLLNNNDFAIDDLYFRESPTCNYQKSVTITVNPNVAPTVGAITHPTCSTKGSVVLNGLPAGNWTINPVGISGNTASVTIPNLTTATYYYTVTNNANNCTSTPVRVDINPIPNSVTPTFNPISPVCVGTTITLPLVSTNGVSGTWSPSFNPNATTTYTFTPNPGECATTATIQVVVSQIPSVIANPNTETICSLQSTGIKLSSSIPTTTFSWNSTPTYVSGDSSDTGNVISQVLTAVNNTSVGNVIYTITPTNNGCSGAPISVTVYVTPKPTLTVTATSNPICSGSPTAINLVGSIPSSTNFSWNLIQNNVTGGSNGTGNRITDILKTINTTPGEAVYTITPEVNGCSGIPTTISIIVNPIPLVIINPSVGQTLCSGQKTAISFSSPVINTNFDWTIVNQNNLNGTLPGSANSISQILSVVLPTDGTATYEVKPNSNGCIGTPVQVSVTVKPIPDFSVTPTQAPICSGDTTSIVLTPSLTGTSISWTVVQNGVTGALGASGTSIIQVLQTTTSAVGNAIYTVTPELNGCVGNPINVTTILNPLPRPSLTDGNVCVDALGVAFTKYTLDSGLNKTDYTFQWFLNGVLQSGSSNTFVASAAGNYSVIATDNASGCVSSSVFATVTSSLPATSISAVGSFAFDENAAITVTALAPNPNYQYALDYGALQFSNVFTNVNPGSHLVTVTDTNGCTNLSTNVFIIGYPTIFTPNGDGFNDYWNVIGLENQPTANMFIFDRYGKLLKQISSKSLGWDGTYLGAPLPSSDYWFTIEYIEPFTTDLKVFKSHFSLKR